MSKPWLKHYDKGVPTEMDLPDIPLAQFLADAAAEHPDTVATVFGARVGSRLMDAQLTYRQLDELVDRFAAGLQEKGVKKGDRVAVMLPNSPQFIVVYYGLLKAGAIVVPLNPLYTERELAFHFEDSGAETVITIPLFLKKAVALREKTPLERVLYSRLGDFMPFPLGLLQGLRERLLVRQAGAGLVDCKNF